MKLSRALIIAVVALCPAATVFAQSSESYDQLMRKYYFTNAMKSLLATPYEAPDNPNDPYSIFFTGNQVSITGKFDGVNNDRLTVFPVVSSRSTDSHNYFRQFVIKSKNGTVPDLYFSNYCQLEDGMYPDYFQFGTSEYSEDGVSAVTIGTLHTVWNIGESPKLGIVIAGHPDGSTIMRWQSYIYNNGKWEQRSPANTAYHTMEECIRAWQPCLNYTPQKHSFTCSTMEYFDQTINTEFVVLPAGTIGMSSNSSELKFGKDIADLIIEGIPPHQLEVRVYENRWGINNDAIVLIDLTTGKTHYYRVFDECDGASDFNGYSLCDDIFLKEVDSVGNPIENDE